jgi:hypothetical protein
VNEQVAQVLSMPSYDSVGVDESCRQVRREDEEVAIRGGLSGEKNTERVYDGPSSENESERI